MSPRVSNENTYFGLTYYLRVWKVTTLKSLSKSMSSRVEFISKFVRMLMILLIQLIIIKSIFSGTEYVKGWSIDEYYLLVGTFNLINYLGWGLFNVNLWRIEEKILKGEYDLLLLKPTGSIFSSSFTEFFLDDAISSLAGFVLVGYYFVNNLSSITFFGLAAYLIALLLGMIIWFNIHLAVASINFLSVKNGLMGLTKSITNTASFPVDIFSQAVRVIFYTILPLALVTTVPTRILSGVYRWEFLLYALIAAVISSIFARWIWNRNLRSYNSTGG